MRHADKMLAFLKVGVAKKTQGYAECKECFAAVGEYVLIDNEAHFTCPKGHKNP